MSVFLLKFYSGFPFILRQILESCGLQELALPSSSCLCAELVCFQTLKHSRLLLISETLHKSLDQNTFYPLPSFPHILNEVSHCMKDFFPHLPSLCPYLDGVISSIRLQSHRFLHYHDMIEIN